MNTTLKNNSWLYLIAGLIITANIVTLAFLWIHRGSHEHPRGGPEKGNMFEYLSKELNLTKQQQDAYDTLRNEHQKAVGQIQDSIRIAKDALFSMLGKDSVSNEALAQQSNKAAALSAQLDIITFRHFEKVRALCTPDQQKKFDGIIQEALRSKGRQGPQKQGPPPDGPPHDGPPHDGPPPGGGPQ